jgi:hypothetical protein
MADTPTTATPPAAKPGEVERLTKLVGDVITLYTALKATVDGLPAAIADQIKAALPQVEAVVEAAEPSSTALDDLEKQIAALQGGAAAKAA